MKWGSAIGDHRKDKCAHALLRGYAGTYLKEEIENEATLKGLQGLGRLLFEQLFFSQLLASAKEQDIPIEVSSFRTRGGLEIDFVLRVHGQTTLVELKASTSIHSGDVQALLNARRTARELEKVQLLLGHLGEPPLRLGEVDALPWQMGPEKNRTLRVFSPCGSC